MRKMDKDGLILCDLQAKAFELSLTMQETSSNIFIRRFMNSKIAKQFDNLAILESNLQAKDIVELIEEEYGNSSYGTIKYSANEMYWIGYMYRYFCYTYEKSTVQVYRFLKPNELRNVFLPYHTMDPSFAIERILEAKGMADNDTDDLQRQFQIYKKVRFNKK